MQSVNETIFDALVRRNVYLMRFAVNAAAQMVGDIDSTTDQLSGFLRRQKKLAKLLQTEPTSRKTHIALNEFTEQVLEIREKGFDKAFDDNYGQLYNLAVSEIDYTDRAITRTLDKTLGEDISLYVVPKQSVNNLLAFGDYGGNDIKTWYKKIKTDDVNRIVGTARTQMAQGKTLDEMEKAVIGTPEFGYHDGIVDRTRRSAETFCRTITVGVANAAREETYKANDDIISQEQFMATLDGRTSIQCAALDGKKYPIGQAPQPPLHPNCRSVIVPVIDGLEDFLVDRPSVPGHNFRQEAREDYIEKWKEKGLTEKEARAKWNDLSNGRINALINEQKRKFSDEAAAPVPGNTTYDEWLRRQPEGFQNEVLGKTRAEAFRNGATLDQFIDANSNQPLTIAEMKEKEPEIFEDKAPAKEDEEPLDRNE